MSQWTGADGWEDTVATYCLGIGLQFGFQTFASRKTAGATQWFPSTTFIATHTLTETLRDVASRAEGRAEPDVPAAIAGLACAVRELHGTIFQPYDTWLKASRLRPAKRFSNPLPDAKSLHMELGDLALYWLIFSEAANLRHTPEMIWFIFYCAQRSWQAKQVLRHLRLHQAGLLELPRQPWIEQLGRGLPRAVHALHDEFRRSQAFTTSFGGGLLQEATLKLPGNLSQQLADADYAAAAKPSAQMSAAAAAATSTVDSAAGGKGRTPVRVTVLADGSVSLPDVAAEPSSGYGSGGVSPSDDVRAVDNSVPGRATGEGEGCVGGTSVLRREGGCPESPCLPMPPRSAHQPGRDSLRSSSVFAAPGGALAAAVAGGVSSSGIKLSEVPPATQSRLQPHVSVLTELYSTPRTPTWDPAVPAKNYKALLLRFCPDEAAVAAALAGGEGVVGSGSSGGGAGESLHAACGGTPFLTKVVQPLFLFMTEQVYELGQARRQGLESAVRIGYDDVSESMAHPRVVAAALAALPWARVIPSSFGSGSGTEVEEGADRHRVRRQEQHPHQRPGARPRAAVHDDELYWSRLLSLSDLPVSGVPRIPWQGDMAHYRSQLTKLLSGTGASSAAGQVSRAAHAAAPVPLQSPDGGRVAGAPGAPGPGRNGDPDAESTLTSLDGEEGDLEAPNPTVEQAAMAAAAVQSLGADASAELGLLRRANAAADWWARHVLRKTFVEHRSVAMPLVAFPRVYQFQLCWFYLLCVWSWSSHNNIMHWIASAAALHWGTNCLLWTMQAVLSVGPRVKRPGCVIPFYVSANGRIRRRNIATAPYDMYGTLWWLTQLLLLALCWGALAAGLYIAYIVWPDHDFFGMKCYPLLWERSCYWWIAVVYAGVLICYEVLYRQFNLGGYVRGHLYDLVLRLMPNGTAYASSSASPIYNPAVFLRTGLSYVFGNAALWILALAIKFVIDYFIIVQPAGPRLKEIMETNKLAWSFAITWSWWPEGWSRHFTVSLDPWMAVAQVILLFLLSMVSSGVAYSVAGALWGAVQGVRQSLGAIRHWRHIRAGFHRVQSAMRAKLAMTEEGPELKRCSWPLQVLAAVASAVAWVLLLPYSCVVWVLRWLGWLPPAASTQPKSWVQREETLGITAPFWNAVVRSMRGRDQVSDREAAALSFTAVSLSPAAMMSTWRRGGSQAAATAAAESQGRQSLGTEGLGPRETFLPPVAVYVAQIPNMVISGSTPTAEQLEVLQEAYLYLLHLMVAVGAIPRSEQAALAQSARSHGSRGGVPLPRGDLDSAAAAAASLVPDLHKDTFHPEKFAGMRMRAGSHQGLVARRELLGAVVGLIRALVETGKVFQATMVSGQAAGAGRASPTAAADAAGASRSRAIDKLCMSLHALGRCMMQMRDLPWSMSLVMRRVVDRQYYHQPAVKTLLHRGFCALVASNRNNATAWGAEHMPSYDDFAKVLSWLLAILRPTDEGTAPSNSEAVSLLAEFCSGLLHPGLPNAPRVDAMRSVSTLIPHYQETVLYALSSADARRVLERAGAPTLDGNLPDDEVLFKNDEGTPSELLQYLVSEFPDEFRNLLERCRTLVPLGKDEQPYFLEDFLKFGRLYEHRAQLLLWASFRGQVLARTVDGMSMYRTALALQAVQDAVKGSPGRGGSGAAPKDRTHLPQQQPGPQRGGPKQPQQGPVLDGRLRLSGVQRMMVKGVLRDTSLTVEELVAQLVDVIPGLGALLDRKYGLVVSSQVFAKMAASRSLADRWRAHGIALLATRYQALRVAYLEQDGEALTLFKAPDFTYRVVHQASVLVRAVPLEREMEVRRQAKKDKAAAVADADATGLTSPATTVPYSACQDAAGPSATPTASWMDGCSVMDDNDVIGSEEEGAEGDDGDAGAALRVWRRRHQLRHLQAAELEVLFRQQLPVNYYDRTASGVGIILGEGKPENQNSALPYCPGVLLQTIDMNQDNSLAQALKLRNATREFEPLGPGPQKQHVAVLGYPEWIFSYRCGLLADLAAATERTFGTQIQRVMAYPSAVRAHYGHPDLWNKLFSMTRGGVSKANAVQHVSEDVFGGYNAMKRGGLSKYVSYISVGKGRDMGLDSILGFEGKISKGCAEQLMSRDLRFLGNSMDFFRAMSLYFTVPGHFINTWLTVLTIRLGVWVQLLLLLGGVGKAGGSLASAMGAIQILQLGTLPLVGYTFNLWLESGLTAALATMARQFIAGGLLFHIFRAVTSAFHLGRAVLFGGASYVATGRGFSLRRKTFTQVYVNYGRSHLYLGMDLLIAVVMILVVGNNGGNTMPIPAAALWSPLLVAAALLAGPFWFTPYFFRLNQVLRDTHEFRSWVVGSAARGLGESWPEWNASQLSSLRDDSGAQVPRYRFWSTLAIVLPRAAIAVLSAIVAVTGAHFATPGVPDLLWVLGGSVASCLLLALLMMTRRAYLSSGLAVSWRWAKGLVQMVELAAIGFLIAVCLFMENKGLRFSGILITLYANYQVASLLVWICVVWFPKTLLARSMSNSAFRNADAALGAVLCAVLIVICFIGEIGLLMVDKVQTLVQFNDRYSHSQAAKPYAGDDDPAAAAAAAGGGGGGGGGLAAATAAALRQRLQMVIVPPRSGNGCGSRVAGGGGATPTVLQGWVSPRYHGPGSATPVFMFHSPNGPAVSGGGASYSPRAAAHTVSLGADAATANPNPGTVATSTATTSPAPAASYSTTPTPTPGARMSLPSVSASRIQAASPRPSMNVQRQTSAFLTSPNVSGVNRYPSGGGGGAPPNPLQAPSRDMSWSSSTPPEVARNAAASAFAASVPRLPPATEWREVAAAAAGAAVSRIAGMGQGLRQGSDELTSHSPPPFAWGQRTPTGPALSVTSGGRAVSPARLPPSGAPLPAIQPRSEFAASPSWSSMQPSRTNMAAEGEPSRTTGVAEVGDCGAAATGALSRGPSRRRMY